MKTRIENINSNTLFLSWGKLGWGTLTFPTQKVSLNRPKFGTDYHYWWHNISIWFICHMYTPIINYWELIKFNWLKLSYINMWNDHAHIMAKPVNLEIWFLLYNVIPYIWLGKQKIRPLAFILSKLEANLYLRCIMYDNFIYLKPVKFMFYKK